MKAEVIAIGDELTSGQRVDTNTAWISQRLQEIGVRVLYHTTVGDDLDANVRVFREAASRADVIVATGGLGPTADDLTREVLAAVTGLELVQYDLALAHIRALFSQRKRDMPERNIVQAMFPKGSQMVHNPHGTAPGIDIDVSAPDGHSARVFALPGVPAEMKEMWHESVGPAIETMLPAERRMIRHKCIKCFGVGESDLESMLPDLIRRGRQPTVGITVSQATISLRISAEGESEEDCFTAMGATIQTIHECLGDLIFGTEEDELQDVVVRMLHDRSKTLSTAEWDTGGIVANWLSDAEGEHQFFRGGLLIGGQNQGAVLDSLGFSNSSFAADSPNLVEDVASHCQRKFDTDYALAVGPCFSQAANSDEPAKFHCAVAAPNGITTKSFRAGGHPDIVKPRAAKQALDFLRQVIDKS